MPHIKTHGQDKLYNQIASRIAEERDLNRHVPRNSPERTHYQQFLDESLAVFSEEEPVNSSVYVLLSLMHAHVTPEWLDAYAIYTRNRVDMHFRFALVHLS